MRHHVRAGEGRARGARRLGIVVALLLSVSLTAAAGLMAATGPPQAVPAASPATSQRPHRDTMPPIIAEWAATAAAVSEADLIPDYSAAAADPSAVGNFIVTVSAGHLDEVLAARKISPIRTYRSAVQGFDAVLTARQLADLRADAKVVSVSTPNIITGFAQVVAPVITRIGADSAPAWAGTGRSSAGGLPTVAVVDSGVEFHPDLNVVGQVNCSSELTATDLGGHGTGVSGVLGASDDTKGVVGVAPGAPVYSVKVLNKSNQGTSSTLLCGLNWISAHAAENNIKVVNLSLGVRGADDSFCGFTNSDPIHQAICSLIAKGVTVVAAAGHISADLAGVIPAAYDEVLTATNMADWDGKPGGLGTPPCNNQTSWKDDRPADDSNYAVSAADIAHTLAAPGACPYTTLRGSRYGYLAGGTSMSSAATSGVVLNCLRPGGMCEGKTPAQIRQTVIDQAKNATLTSDHGYTGDPRTSTGRYYGWLLSARQAPLPASVEPSPSASVEPSPSPSPSASVEPSPSPSASVEPSPSPSPSASVEPSPTPSPSASVEPSPTPSPSASVEPSPTPSESVSVEPSPSASVEPSPTPSPSASVEPSPTPSPSASVEPSPTPSPVGPTPDTTAPTVRLVSPGPGARISGTWELQASASDDVGVTAVTFLLGDQAVGQGVQHPDGSWRANLDTTRFANNAYVLRAMAVDAAGNTGSGSHKIRIENAVSPTPTVSGDAGPDTTAPIVAMTSPATGARLSGNARLVASASDNVGVTAVTFWVRTSRIATGALQPDGSWEATINTAGFANGTYDITAKASDGAGNQATSLPVTVQVSN